MGELCCVTTSNPVAQQQLTSDEEAWQDSELASSSSSLGM